MNKYNVVLFDMDGTIANTDPLILEAYHFLYDKYKNGNRRPDEEIYYFSGPTTRSTMEKEFPNRNTDEMIKEFMELTSGMYERLVTTYPNCRHTLLELKKRGIKLGVVTNKTHNPAIKCLEVCGLENIYDVVIGSDDVKVGKPDKEGILKALDLLNVKDFNKVLYVGDNAIDLETATNAGIDCCLCIWGPRKLEPTVKPKYKIYEYKELEEVCFDEN